MIAITALGAISSIGSNVPEHRDALAQGISGMGPLQYCETQFAGKMPFGEVPFSNHELEQRLNISDSSVTRTSLLALHALSECIAGSGCTGDELQSTRTALVVGNTVGGMCLTDSLYADANLLRTGSPYLKSYDCGHVTLFLQKHFKIGGLCNTINTACSSSSNAIQYGVRLIQTGLADRALVGGADSLSKFTINGFNALGILSEQDCKPFDRQRKGLNLGEAAGFIMLERVGNSAPKPVYVRVSGFANRNDAFHPSALSDEGHGPYLAMQNALNTAQLNPLDIDFISAHGTGTENNDLVESRAMLRLFGTVPPFVSFKSRIGHTLGASAAVESVLSLISLTHQELYPGLRFEQPIEETGLKPIQTTQKKKLQHVMSNSFGFGGNCSSLIFSQVP